MKENDTEEYKMAISFARYMFGMRNMSIECEMAVCNLFNCIQGSKGIVDITNNIEKMCDVRKSKFEAIKI